MRLAALRTQYLKKRPTKQYRREKGGEENWIEHSSLSNTKRVEEVSFEAEACRAQGEIGAHPQRLEAALDPAGEPLAAALKTEELSGRDDLAFHPCDLGNTQHPADAVAHAFDM